MERSKDNAMELGENVFLQDPFLSLDSDLDDVSEVIRNNLLVEQPGLYDNSSRTPSPQYMRDTDIFIPQNHSRNEVAYAHDLPTYPPITEANMNSYDKEIGQIVSLLQDDQQNPLLSSPGPSMQQCSQYVQSPFASGVQVKADYNTMDTMSDVYDMHGASTERQFLRSNSSPAMDHQMDFQQSSSNIPSLSAYQQVITQDLHPQQQPYVPLQHYDSPYDNVQTANTSDVYAYDTTKPLPTHLNQLSHVVIDETAAESQLQDYPSTHYSVYNQNDATTRQNDSPNNAKQEIIKMLLEMSPSEFNRIRTQKQHNLDKRQPTSPTPIDPIRKRSSIQLSSTPTTSSSLQQPLMISVAGHRNQSLTSLDSPIATTTSNLSPPLVSPESTASGFVNDWREDSDNESSALQLYPNGKKGPRTERRTAHNLIEKKYRCSINDRINHLKEMLAPEEAKLSKSATLRKAIEHITSLRQQNMDLLRENGLLKQSIKALGGEPPLVVAHSIKFNHTTQSARSRDSSESPLSDPSSASNSPRRSKKTNSQMLNQSRVSLCVFMLMVVMWNPFAILFGGPENTTHMGVETTDHIVGRIPVRHRTLKAFGGDYPFDMEAESSNWWHRAFTRHALIWLVNGLIVFIILTRLLIHGEPVADRRSPTWMTFMKTKQNAMDAIIGCNYKEAQRQLSEALYILGRPLPRRGGLDEFMSITWQVIRHILNAVWIGRWFSRRRRSKTISAPTVCRSHATTAIVYHQLNQLYLLGIDALDSGPMSGLNLALSAVNLAESAGISRDGVSHQQRADIYIHAALTTKKSLPRFISQITSAYFLRRARRHVQKSGSVDNVEMKCYRWIFHPLARTFLTEIDALNEILINNRQMANYPFVNPLNSPKPIDRLTSAFKMHLLALLMNQLNSSSPTLRVMDFVDISHLLLNISTSDQPQSTNDPRETILGDDVQNDWDSTAKGQGDELCTWWTHVITCGLYWKYGDNQRAQKHYALIRKCPKLLLNSNLALGVGMALCTRKICNEDQNKKEFVNMVWFHAKGSYAHILREEVWNSRKKSSMAIAMNPLVRCLTFYWILNSLLDVWQLSLDNKQLYWEQTAPSQMRRLYYDVLSDYRLSCRHQPDRFRILIFKLLGRLLDGANPLNTWQLLLKQYPNLNENEESLDSSSQNEIIKRLRSDLQVACKI
ncbi:BHLH domain-containing protein [Aphelenchoides besseyi]|nr:BHLH domain-containing protein [Aphelenchoides besseyi]